MSDQYDVEQGILDCWHITDDLKTLCEGVLDNNLNTDDIANALIGLQTLYQLKFDKLFTTHAATFNPPKYSMWDETVYTCGDGVY